MKRKIIFWIICAIYVLGIAALNGHYSGKLKSQLSQKDLTIDSLKQEIEWIKLTQNTDSFKMPLTDTIVWTKIKASEIRIKPVYSFGKLEVYFPRDTVKKIRIYCF